MASSTDVDVGHSLWQTLWTTTERKQETVTDTATPLVTEPFPAALEEARTLKGLSFKKLERLLWQRLGPHYTPSDEKLRALHRDGVDPERVDLVLVLAIARIYGVPASSLDPVIARRLTEVRELVTESRWIIGPVSPYLPGMAPTAA